MSTTIQPKKEYNLADKCFALIVSEYGQEITDVLYESAYHTLTGMNAVPKNIIRKNVPGSYELPLGAKKMAVLPEIDAVICLGCIIKGETPHFDYLCTAISHGILRVSLDCNKPVSWGVITSLNRMQALHRSGGNKGNKGEDAARAAVKMLYF